MGAGIMQGPQSIVEWTTELTYLWKSIEKRAMAKWQSARNSPKRMKKKKTKKKQRKKTKRSN